MNMPGFTAEASVYPRSGHYQMTASRAGGDATQVNPAQVTCEPCPGGGQVCCRPAPEVGEPEVCWSDNCVMCVPHTYCYQDPSTTNPRCQICVRETCTGINSMWHTC